MICAPTRTARSGAAGAFDFAGSPNPASRMMENAAILWTAPWRAYWTLAFEAMDPANYRR